MKLRFRHVAPILVAVLLLGGCAQGGQAHRAESDQPGGHAHAPAGQSLGLKPAVVDAMEFADVALIKDGKLAEVDLINTVVALHGLYAIPREGTVLITIDDRTVAWSEAPADYPVVGTIPGPVRYMENRLRMSGDQFAQLIALAFPKGSYELKDGKLVVATGR